MVDMIRRSILALVVLLGLGGTSLAAQGPRFDYTPPQGGGATYRYHFDGDTSAPNGSGAVTQYPHPSGSGVGYDWERDGDDIVVKDAQGETVCRFVNGAIAGEGATADEGSWENIDFQDPI